MEQKQEKNWALFCHLGALAGYVIPFGNIIAPLVIWLIKKEESTVIAQEGKKSLNFQISVAIYSIVAGLLTFIVIGMLLLPAVLIFNLVMIIIAAVKINKGEPFEYPLSLKLIK